MPAKSTALAVSHDSAPENGLLHFLRHGRNVLAVLAINFVGDGLRDALDPQTRR